jgi:dynein heavy chain
VEEQMIVSVRNEIENSHKVYPKYNRANWVLEWAGQVVLCVAMIYWTVEVQHILRLKKLEKLKEYYKDLQVSVNLLFLSIIA